MMDDPIEKFINTYHDFNSLCVDELSEPPSALEFMRYVATNRPFVVRQGAQEWEAVKKWNAAYLREVMGEQSVNVAVTPFGNADAVVEQEDETLLFVEPYNQEEIFSEFFDYIQEDSKYSENTTEPKVVKYAQTRLSTVKISFHLAQWLTDILENDNLRDEYRHLYSDVPDEISFARIALQKEADAVNLWIGNERSITALHKDNYENVYVQIAGQKHFVLLPPVEMPCVNEQLVPLARYRPVADEKAEQSNDLVIERGRDSEPVPVPTWDPDVPSKRTTAYSHLAQPLRVTLNKGDMLYLPAMWYHKVSQTAGEEGFACAVNYWYDMDFGGSLWAENAFLRDVVAASSNAVEYPELTLESR